MSLDGLPGVIDSATATVSSVASGVSNFISQGPAAALTQVGNAITGALGSLGSLFKPLAGVQLPLPNPLFKYATYDYILGLYALDDDSLNDPDSGYMSSLMGLSCVCKSANSDPFNRVTTAFGKFDFFIEKLEINSQLGMEKGDNSNMLNGSITIVEPYSMGMFMMSIQEAAWKAGQDNYLVAPFLLTIDFRGNTETGSMVNIPNTSRRIPFTFLNIAMKVTEKGAVYTADLQHASASALASDVAELKTDVSVSGSTVQEALQTGDKSLQVALNKRLQQLKKDKIVDEPDQILILFPTDSSSAGESSGEGTEDNTGATTSASADSVSSVAAKLGVTVSSKNDTLVQASADCNLIGKAKMGFDETRKGDAPSGKDNQVYDKDLKINVRGNNTIDPTTSDLKFRQNSDIINAINQTILASEYAKNAMKKSSVDDKGFRDWWRIDTQVYNITSQANLETTGTKPRLIVYRVVPYKSHSGKIAATNSKPPGYEEIKVEVVKEYNYIYTGKNVDIINFDINCQIGFAGAMSSGPETQTQDNKTKSQQGGADENGVSVQPTEKGQAPSKKPGTIPTQNRYSTTDRKTDRKGGGGVETQETRAAKQFHDAMSSGADMISLEMQIIGDPYYIAQSGTGNYTAKPSQYMNLNSDNTVNYQNGEVDILINFRTPVDINQSTGLYDFGKSSQNAPVLSWSGLYHLLTVSSTFENGQFKQTLKGNRRPLQDLDGSGTVTNASDNTVKNPADPNGNGIE